MLSQIDQLSGFLLTVDYKLSEYIHVEAELDFINFDDLLSYLEHIICRVLDLVLDDPSAYECIKKYDPDLTKSTRPSIKTRYSDPIEWLRGSGIKTADGRTTSLGTTWKFPYLLSLDMSNGDLTKRYSAEAAERKTTDEINRPVLLTHFQVALKYFYMHPDPEEPRVMRRPPHARRRRGRRRQHVHMGP